MKLASLPVSWFDFLAVLILLLGLVRGRKRGLSEELLDMAKWMTTIVVAGYFYEPLGTFLARRSVFSLLSCYLAVYLILCVLVRVMFAQFKRAVGEKLVGSDVFGGGEYYLGMLAGMLRYTSVLIAVLALLHARQYTAQELSARERAADYNFGSIRFPSLHGLQQEIFVKSWTGRMADEHLSLMLIERTHARAKPLRNEANLARQRERAINAVLETR